MSKSRSFYTDKKRSLSLSVLIFRLRVVAFFLMWLSVERNQGRRIPSCTPFNLVQGRWYVCRLLISFHLHHFCSCVTLPIRANYPASVCASTPSIYLSILDFTREMHIRIRVSMLKLYRTYAYNILAIWYVRTVCAAAFAMLIHLHPERLFAIQSGPDGIHLHFADAAFKSPTVS